MKKKTNWTKIFAYSAWMLSVINIMNISDIVKRVSRLEDKDE